MKHLRIAFGLVVMAGLLAVAAAPAMALSPRWEQCKTVEIANSGNWKDSLCSVPQGSGTWLTMQLTEKETEEVTSKSIGKIELTDTKATGGASTVACEGGDRGTIGANGADQEIEVFATSCVRITGACTSNVRATAINLPWITQLVEEPAGKIRNTLRSEIAGKSPGYVVECSVQGIFTVEDECVGPISTAMSNLPNGNVLSEFDKKSEEEKESSTCKLGGPKSGIVKGKVEIQQKKNVATYVNLR
jgi:hypothetical protein